MQDTTGLTAFDSVLTPFLLLVFVASLLSVLG